MWIKFLLEVLLVMMFIITECFGAGGSCSICNIMAGLKRPGELPQIETQNNDTQIS